MQERNTTTPPQLLEALGLRPLSARSVVASVLLGTHPPRLSAAALVELCGRFGIAGGTTRVALSRMVAAGELAVEDGHYRLVGEALLSRQRAQDAGLDPPVAPWTGGWRMAVVVSAGRAAAERVELRRAFADARFAEWREGVWLRPDNLGPPSLAAPASVGGTPPVPRAVPLPEAPVRWLSVEPDGDPKALAAELWDLPGWAARGAALLAAAPEEPGDLVASPPEWAASVFAAAAAAVSFLRTDPLLPAPLLPADWPADRLRGRYATYIAAIQALVGHLSRS
ncbi:MAG TPA: PaaX domain-containing protein, C- domain protein [Acidimicrobiia bacterium]|nr:PaaX domain-containing protein, C- domain protein [Acidimicrobiia bacterium]